MIPVKVEKLVPLLWYKWSESIFYLGAADGCTNQAFSFCLICKLEFREKQRSQACLQPWVCLHATLACFQVELLISWWLSNISGDVVPFWLCCRALRHLHTKAQCLFSQEDGIQAASFHHLPVNICKGIIWSNFLSSCSWIVRFPTQPESHLMYSFALVESNFFQK